jgi:hypothetical protein
MLQASAERAFFDCQSQRIRGGSRLPSSSSRDNSPQLDLEPERLDLTGPCVYFCTNIRHREIDLVTAVADAGDKVGLFQGTPALSPI